jgi:hypothetical protein
MNDEVDPLIPQNSLLDDPRVEVAHQEWIDDGSGCLDEVTSSCAIDNINIALCVPGDPSEIEHLHEMIVAHHYHLESHAHY